MTSRPSYRSLYATFWDDAGQQALSDRAYRVLTALKGTMPMPGISVVFDDLLAKRCGCTENDIQEAFVELERPKVDGSPGWIVRERNIIWLVNGLRFEPNISPNDPKHRRFVAECLTQFGGEATPFAIVRRFKEHYAQWFPGDAPSSPRKGFRPPSHDSGSDPEHLPDAKPLPKGPSEGANKGPSRGPSEAQPIPRTNTTQPNTSARDAVIEPTYTTRCTVALNLGMQSNASVAGMFMEVSASSQASAVLWEQDGIPVDVAEEVIGRVCSGFRPTARSRQIHGLKYFDGNVRERWEQIKPSANADRMPLVKGAKNVSDSAWLAKQGY